MTLQMRRTIAAHRSVDCLAISKDGGTIATGGNDPGNIGNTVKLWDAQNGVQRHRLRANKGGVSEVAFNGDGTRVASVGHDGELRLWNAQTGGPLWAMNGHRGVVWAVAFSPDGKIVATGGRDGFLLIWDSQAGTILERHDSGAGILSLAFSADGSVLVSAEGRERKLSGVKFRSRATGELLQAWDGHTDWPLWAEYSPNGTSVGSGSYGELLIRHATSATVVRTFKPDRWSMTEFAWSPDGTAVAASGWDHSTVREEVPGGWNEFRTGRLQVWDTHSGESIDNIVAHDRELSAVKFSPSGGLLVTAGRDGTVKLWDFVRIDRRSPCEE